MTDTALAPSQVTVDTHRLETLDAWVQRAEDDLAAVRRYLAEIRGYQLTPAHKIGTGHTVRHPVTHEWVRVHTHRLVDKGDGQPSVELVFTAVKTTAIGRRYTADRYIADFSEPIGTPVPNDGEPF